MFVKASLYWKGWVDILKNGWIREILLKSDILDVESCSRFTWKFFKFYDILTCSEIRIMKGTPFLYNIHIKLDHKNHFQNFKKILWWAFNVELAIFITVNALDFVSDIYCNNHPRLRLGMIIEINTPCGVFIFINNLVRGWLHYISYLYHLKSWFSSHPDIKIRIT